VNDATLERQAHCGVGVLARAPAELERFDQVPLAVESLEGASPLAPRSVMLPLNRVRKYSMVSIEQRQPVAHNPEKRKGSRSRRVFPGLPTMTARDFAAGV
jgi:hypothetical protein